MSNWFKIKKLLLSPILWFLGASSFDSPECRHLEAKRWIRNIKIKERDGDPSVDFLIQELKYHLNRK